MKVRVRYWSWFKDLAGSDHEDLVLTPGARVEDALSRVHQLHPELAQARRSTLIAVGLEYQGTDFQLHDGDEISLFPPVQGG